MRQRVIREDICFKYLVFVEPLVYKTLSIRINVTFNIGWYSILCLHFFVDFFFIEN